MNLRIKGRRPHRHVPTAAWLAAASAAGVGLFALQTVVAHEPARTVLVTTRDVERGERLTRAVLDFRDVPERYVEERHVRAEEIEDILDAPLATALHAGAALLWTDLDGPVIMPHSTLAFSSGAAR